MNDVKILFPADVDWEAYRALRLEALREEPQAFGSSYEETIQLPDSFWQGRLAEAVEGRTNWMLFASQYDRLVGMVVPHTSWTKLWSSLPVNMIAWSAWWVRSNRKRWLGKTSPLSSQCT